MAEIKDMRDTLVGIYHKALWSYANWRNTDDDRLPSKKPTRVPGAKHVTIRKYSHDGWGREVIIENRTAPALNPTLQLTTTMDTAEASFDPFCYALLDEREILTSLIAVAEAMRPSEFDIWVGVDPSDSETAGAILAMERMA